MVHSRISAAVLLGAALWGLPCLGASLDKGLFTADELEKIYTLSPVPPLPADDTNAFADNPKAASFGKVLFFDKRLSCAGNVSCATCHDPKEGWSDKLATPKVFTDPKKGASKAFSRRRVPSLWNVAYNPWQFWDGRADSLWAQALGPPENAIEMEGGSRLQYAHVIYNDKKLRARYEALFGKMPDLADTQRYPPTGCPKPSDPSNPDHVAWMKMKPADQTAVNRVYANLGKSLAAFERKIVSKHSRFDTYVEGLRDNNAKKLAALDQREKRGLKLFVGKGLCLNCHTGPHFTDGGFHNLRVPSKDKSLPEDLGRYDGIALVKKDLFNGTGPFSDDPSGAAKEKLDYLRATDLNKGQFKTPGLRNVARFAPYMHQGQVATLKEVVQYYSTLEGATKLKGPDDGLLVAVHLTDPEVDDLVAFLESLTDESANRGLTMP